ARALVEARGVLILLRHGADLHVAAIAGRFGDDLLDVRVPVEDTISGHVMRTGRVQRLADVRERLRFTLAERVNAETGMFVPLIFRGRALGILSAFDRGDGDEFTREDERLLESFAASAATAVATAQTVASEGLRRSIEASERERQRWARELHDETLQELAGLKVLLGGARRSRDLAAVHATLETAVEQIDTEIAGLRRLITDLRPAALDTFGVKSALEGLAERISATSGLEVELEIALAHDDGSDAERLPAPVEDAVYRLVQEALTNVSKHAGATRVGVCVEVVDATVQINITDDGCGFDPDAQTGGFGLIGMRERVTLAGGILAVESATAQGTAIRATVPIDVAAASSRA
ncbi:GAF domain-containing sensor histidine kinase, partial [Conexibacter sp. CPCC 206217]|uniref:GAF domain-containing sensor histidine kinase n=1 Tax=Conexibacter sp. CPCC 206217 TaxID=3064574 RepID=UPI00271CFACD